MVSRELSPADSILTVCVIKLANEYADTFPFCEAIYASKLSTTVCTIECDVSDTPRK